MQIQHHVAIVTGGLSGLGEATAKHLLAQGARVAIFDLAQTESDEHTLCLQVDVTDEQQVSQAIEEVLSRFGQIDICINCAGIAPAKKIIDRENRAMPLSDFATVMNVNVLGSFNMCAKAAGKMLLNTPDSATGERGIIINTASIAAYDGQKGQCAYAASKGAIASLTLPLARDLSAFNIRAMAIAPGVMATPMMRAMPEKVQQGLENTIPFPSRMGKGEEFADLVAHIIENPYLNGEVIRLDGGLRM